MSSVEALHDQYSQELKGFGASLPDDLLQGLQGLSEIYDQSQTNTIKNFFDNLFSGLIYLFRQLRQYDKPFSEIPNKPLTFPKYWDMILY